MTDAPKGPESAPGREPDSNPAHPAYPTLDGVSTDMHFYTALPGKGRSAVREQMRKNVIEGGQEEAKPPKQLDPDNPPPLYEDGSGMPPHPEPK